MAVNRMCYIVFYQGKHVLTKLETLPLNLTYISQKQNYAVFYADQNQENNIKKQLKEVKGFKHMMNSPIFNESLNLAVKWKHLT